MTTSRTEPIPAPDGRTGFSGYLAVPAVTPAPGLLVIQEIFGVNDYIRGACDRLAAHGYLALAPEVYWRMGDHLTFAHTEQGIAEGIGAAGRLDRELAVADLTAALAHLRTLPESDGRAGSSGFCFGGTMTFVLAATADPDVGVSYYGSGVGGLVGQMGDGVSCPLIFQYGGDDPYIPLEEIQAVADWAAGRPDVEVNVHPAGHAFDNQFAPMFSNPDAAGAAWGQTLAFLTRHMPIGA
jgi:carboxymethylenebutenolidase